ncbi:hypothetical protein ACFO5R_02640 [Halosolutus amylolyticus]|uniref:Uncharacterized protein n=1 Tax=Halosolutus amylolyticus TaxID=2932267 RepID=A0ABD5PJR4_9EURY|nr:hypothetical protein [Halosolutus amylolyticus]
MKLSPFETTTRRDEWLRTAPLYGKSSHPYSEDRYAFEVFPSYPDEDTSDWKRVPRDSDEYEKRSFKFNIEKANVWSDYILVLNTYNRPTLRWYSCEAFKDEFLYDPLDPPRPQGVDPLKWKKLAEKRIRGGIDRTPMRLDTDKRTFLQRLVKLWNGDVVCGVHLLWDQCPSIHQLTKDLDEDRLNRLYYDTTIDREILLTYRDACWFDLETEFLKPTALFRKRVWYDLTQKCRLLINGRSEFPDLKGGPLEGLVHRVTVGLVALKNTLEGNEVRPYLDTSEYVVDLVSRDPEGQVYTYEIMTDHNNRELYRKTYEKLKVLDQHGKKTIAVFDSRETAYKVFNYWHNQGLGVLPNGPFKSDYSVENGRNQIQDAYESETHEWAVADWTTTWKLKQQTLSSNSIDLNREQVLSLDW